MLSLRDIYHYTFIELKKLYSAQCMTFWGIMFETNGPMFSSFVSNCNWFWKELFRSREITAPYELVFLFYIDLAPPLQLPKRLFIILYCDLWKKFPSSMKSRGSFTIGHNIISNYRNFSYLPSLSTSSSFLFLFRQHNGTKWTHVRGLSKCVLNLEPFALYFNAFQIQ